MSTTCVVLMCVGALNWLSVPIVWNLDPDVTGTDIESTCKSANDLVHLIITGDKGDVSAPAWATNLIYAIYLLVGVSGVVTIALTLFVPNALNAATGWLAALPALFMIFVWVGALNWLSVPLVPVGADAVLTADGEPLCPPATDLFFVIFNNSDVGSTLSLVVYALVGVAGLVWALLACLPMATSARSGAAAPVRGTDAV